MFGAVGQQEVQRKLQGDNWGRFPDQGSPGGRPVGDDAGRSLSVDRRRRYVMLTVAVYLWNRSGIPQVKNDSSL